MGSIYDVDLPDDLNPSTEEEKPEKPKRSKKRDVEELTPADVRAGKRRLMDMVEGAFATLELALEKADWNNAIRAAVAILDRSGFGPKTTVDINANYADLADLSNEQLAARATALAAEIRSKKGLAAAPTSPTVN